jgi:hypothetical protein
LKQEKQTVNPSDVIGKSDILRVRGIVLKEGHLFLTILRTCGHQQQKVHYMSGNSE